jgi:hypothetical protein
MALLLDGDAGDDARLAGRALAAQKVGKVVGTDGVFVCEASPPVSSVDAGLPSGAEVTETASQLFSALLEIGRWQMTLDESGVSYR